MENYAAPVRRAIEREKRRKAAIAAIHALDSTDCVSWKAAAEALSRKGSINELGHPWTWSVLRQFVQIQHVVHGVSFEGGLLVDGMTNKISGGARRRWARTGRADEVARAIAESNNAEEAAVLLNGRGVATGSGNRWNAERVKSFAFHHRDDALRVLEAMKPDPSLTWDDLAAKLNETGCLTQNCMKWTVNNLRGYVAKHRKARGSELLQWLDDRQNAGQRYMEKRDRLAVKIAEVVAGLVGFGACADALNQVGLKTLLGKPWSAKRLKEFDARYAAVKGERLITTKRDKGVSMQGG